MFWAHSRPVTCVAPQATGALGAPSAPPVAQSAQYFGIDIAVLSVLTYFYRQEDAARERQMSRISREERLGDLRVREPHAAQAR